MSEDVSTDATTNDAAQAARQAARSAAVAAKRASVDVALLTNAQRNDILFTMARALRDEVDVILKANDDDMVAARQKGTKESLLDRLMLDNQRVFDMATALEDLASLPDPLGRILDHRKLYNGLDLTRVTVPMGVVAVVYEARPNVTADAAGICLKSGNACVLRGGSLASRSCAAIAAILERAAVSAGAPAGCISFVDAVDHAATDELMSLRGVVDVLIPRGGAGLINHCVKNAQVPVIETGTGNCHVYVHESADLDKARSIIVNAKCRRYGVCNAAETLLVDRKIAKQFLPATMSELAKHGVLLHCDDEAFLIASRESDVNGRARDGTPLDFVEATEEDWATEYLAPELAIRCVDSVDEAIEHVNRYGTHHSESICAADEDACMQFATRVDAAAVYVNASTAFTDGGQFGLGAEIGISTQKLHVRGPFALEGLTSYKYVVRGDGQVRA